jgi:hypothetical protein
VVGCHPTSLEMRGGFSFNRLTRTWRDIIYRRTISRLLESSHRDLVGYRANTINGCSSFCHVRCRHDHLFNSHHSFQTPPYLFNASNFDSDSRREVSIFRHIFPPISYAPSRGRGISTAERGPASAEIRPLVCVCDGKQRPPYR